MGKYYFRVHKAIFTSLNLILERIKHCHYFSLEETESLNSTPKDTQLLTASIRTRAHFL